MEKQHYLDLLRRGAAAWNEWRGANLDTVPDLAGADLSGLDLNGIHLSGAFLKGADLRGTSLRDAHLLEAYLREAQLDGADLSGAELESANLNEATLRGACLREAFFNRVTLVGSIMNQADLRDAEFVGADLSFVELRDANLRGSSLCGACFREADLTGSDLTGADLSWAQLIETKLDGANLTGCQVYGVSAWNLQLEQTEQKNLLINRSDEPVVTVDNLEVAQFIYLLLNNSKIRDVINTITSKAVLILGRFTPQRKSILDALREELRKKNYLPILFDFDIPTGRDVTETVTLLARMSRFIVADLTEPSSIPKELEAIIPTLAVPVQPLLEGAEKSSHPFSMFKDYWKYDWVLGVHRYDNVEGLLLSLEQSVIAPAEQKAVELEKRKAGAMA